MYADETLFRRPCLDLDDISFAAIKCIGVSAPAYAAEQDFFERHFIRRQSASYADDMYIKAARRWPASYQAPGHARLLPRRYFWHIIKPPARRPHVITQLCRPTIIHHAAGRPIGLLGRAAERGRLRRAGRRR